MRMRFESLGGLNELVLLKLLLRTENPLTLICVYSALGPLFPSGPELEFLLAAEAGFELFILWPRLF